MNKDKIAVIGLGYVGLPLARLFATKYAVVGFDINKTRVDELQKGIDATLEVEKDILQSVLKKESDDSANQLPFSLFICYTSSFRFVRILAIH